MLVHLQTTLQLVLSVHFKQACTSLGVGCSSRTCPVMTQASALPALPMMCSAPLQASDHNTQSRWAAVLSCLRTPPASVDRATAEHSCLPHNANGDQSEGNQHAHLLSFLHADSFAALSAMHHLLTRLCPCLHRGVTVSFTAGRRLDDVSYRCKVAPPAWQQRACSRHARLGQEAGKVQA